MMIGKQWIQRGVLCGLLLGGLVPGTVIAGPPVGQIAQSDHAAVAAWYDKEAADLRQRAKDMMVSIEEYRKNPGYSTREAGVSPKTDFLRHCQNLASMYTKGAEEAEELAREHRSMLK
jgi:hypothetical protein